MRIRSLFESHQEIPVLFTCRGQNINPPLFFDEVPAGTQSLVLLLEDMDADPLWVHWHLYNIPADSAGVPEGKIPPLAKQGLCNNHTLGYEGPCPKYFQGTHRYRFTLYALNEVLHFDKDPEPAETKEKMEAAIIEEAELWFQCSSDD